MGGPRRDLPAHDHTGPTGTDRSDAAAGDPTYRPDTAALAPSSLTDRARRNLTALATLDHIDQRDGLVTDHDRARLGLWTGWGALPQLFDPSVDREPFAGLRRDLEQRLDTAELRAASSSTLNAHYTDPEVINAVWRLCTTAGFAGGRVLEPGCGSGLFIGLAPDDVRRASRFVGVEIEPTTARIAAALYPEAEIRGCGLETVREPDGCYDLAVGNVPFGKYALFDPIHNPDRASIHNYFAIKALHLVKPGGLVAIVTSRYTLDARNPAARRAMYDLADLTAAIRLPNGAHQRIAGTQVVTDVLVFRRRHPHEVPAPFDWERTPTIDVDGHEVRVNDWFTPHGRGRIVGTLTAGRGMYSDGELMVDPPAAGIDEALADTIDAVTPTIAGRYDPTPAKAVTPPVRAETGVKAVAGELGVSATGMLVVHGHDGATTVTSGTRDERAQLVALVRVRDAARAVMAAQNEPPTAESVRAWDEARTVLNDRYDGYRTRWPAINATRETTSGRRQPVVPKRFRDDPGWGLVAALERFDETTQQATKAAIFGHWLATPQRRYEGAETPVEALATSLAATGRVDLEMVADLLACDPQPALAELAAAGMIFRSHDNPDDWHAAVHYLSGDVRERLRQVRPLADTDPRYAANVAALESVQPEWLPGEAISARLGAVWIPASDVTQFLVDTLGASPESTSVEHAPIIGTWTVTNYGGRGSVAATVEWGTDHADAYALVADALNLTPTVVYRTDSDGKRIKLEAETLAANDKRTALEAAFADWVWTDPERAGRLEQVYNDRFNSTVLARWDGAHLQHIPGLSGAFEPHRHQLNVVWRHLADDRNVLLGHKVGAGKTATMVIAGQEMRRTGQITKPLYVVPNHMLDQFAAEFRQLYPMADVLVATKTDLEASSRRRFVARCATGEWHAVVMTHATFGRIPVAVETERAFLEAQQERFLAAAEQARAAGGKHTTVKAIERAAARWNTRLSELRDVGADANNVTFEQLGVDYVFVDEAHAFKGLPFVSSLPIGTAQSKRATDMALKVDWLHTVYGNKVATFATGTPVTNSLAEMWVMQRFLAHDLLVDAGLEAFDSWAGTFARPVTRMELAPEGGRFRLHTRIAAFDNVPELLTGFRTFCDLLDAADLPSLRVPDLAGGRAETVVVASTPELAGLIAELGDRADAVRSRAVAAEVDNMLKVCNDGRLASLDLRLVDRDQDPDVGKVTSCAARVAELWHRYRDTAYLDTAGRPSPTTGALQVVFCDKGTPSAGFNVYDEVRDRLTAAGLDPARVRYIHEANTDQAKERLFNACRSGDVDVLIGSTEKMGVGTNIQARLVALHHLDAPWRPADIEQREGRILRHGNQNRIVHVVRYVTEGSFDPYMWQTLERKARFIAQVMSPADPHDAARSIEDLDTEVVLSYAEIKAVATGNPLIREQAEVAGELARLSRLAANHTKAQRALPGRLASLRDHERRLADDIVRLDAYRRHAVDTRGDAFTITLADGTTHTDRVDAGDAIRQRTAPIPADRSWRPLGHLGGLDWEWIRHPAPLYGYDTDTSIRVVGDTETVSWPTREFQHGVGAHVILTRLERHLERTGDRLTAARHDHQLAVEQIGRGERTLGQPFAHQHDLDQFTQRLQAVEAELAATLQPDPALATGTPATVAPRIGPEIDLGP